MARRIAGLLGLVGLLLAWPLLWDRGTPPLVVYCAHDAVFAREILDRFERDTGIPLAVRYDTEATKSLGLVELLRRERRRPRCHVFWNNELLGMLSLADAGALVAYKGPGWQRIPDAFKDPEGRWTGFAARLRVTLVDARRHPVEPAAVARTLAGRLERVAIAKPLYGTTLTHYTVLWQRMGPDKLKAWHADWRARGVQELGGNGPVMRAVVAGACDLGLTDTDDAYAAIDAGHPVAMLPVEVAGRTIAIPNTAALIRDDPRARQLVDYLLSAATERALARSRARQIPLGPVDDAELPPEVRRLRAWAARGVDLTGLGEARTACLAWLKAEYQK